MNASDFLKTAARSGFYVISRMILFLMLGIFLNMLFLAFLSPEISKLSSEFSGPGPGHAGGGGAGAILALLILAFLYWKVILLLLAFGVAFPLGYLILGKQYGAQKAILSAIASRQKFLTTYLVERLFDRLQNKTNLLEKVRKNELRTLLQEQVPKYLKKLENMPFLLRVIFKRVLGKWSPLQVIERTLDTLNEDPVDLFSLKNALIEQIDSSIEQKFFSQSYSQLVIFVAINLAVFSAIKIFV